MTYDVNQNGAKSAEVIGKLALKSQETENYELRLRTQLKTNFVHVDCS